MSDPTDPPGAEPFEATGTWQVGTPPVSAEIEGEDRASKTIRTNPGSCSPGRRAAADALPVPGERLGTYVLEEAIGAGGMGAVFRAIDERLDRQVALKLLPPAQAHDSEVVQRFYQEARAAARLDHENIARVFSIEHDDARQFHYIAFEYIEGETIRQRVAERGPLAVSEAINYTLQIASALVHASERGVVHRDIKPSNIIITPNGRAKLVDMGLARQFERDTGDDEGLTQSGMTLGTFDYISPEQARDPRDVDVRSDLYSLGCTLFHMLTGRPPFPEGTVLQKLLQHQEEVPPDVRSINPIVPVELSTIVAKMMAKERDRRYQTPEQLVRDLLTLAGSLQLRSISPEGLVWMSPSIASAWPRRLIWLAPLVSLAIIVGVLIWWGQTEGSGAAGNATTTPEPTKSKSSLAQAEAPSVAESTTSPSQAMASVARHELTVKSSSELALALEEAPAGATITLEGNDPFELPGGSKEVAGADLTIRAAPKSRPVLALEKTSDAGDEAILSFRSGRIVLDGLTFDLEGRSNTASRVAIHADDTVLTVLRCVFRVPEKDQALSGRVAALQLREGDSNRSAPVRLEECLFALDQVAIWSQGPLDLKAKDCAFGMSSPCFWLDNANAEDLVPASVGLSHVSILAGNGPVFRLARTAATIQVDDCVIASGPASTSELVETDNPGHLDWLGRRNVFARIDPFLQPAHDASESESIRSFRQWAQDADHVREIDSVATGENIWLVSDPSQVLVSVDPMKAFELDVRALSQPGSGAIHGPSGLIRRLTASKAATRTAPSSSPGPGGETTASGSQPTVPEPMTLAVTAQVQDTNPDQEAVTLHSGKVGSSAANSDSTGTESSVLPPVASPTAAVHEATPGNTPAFASEAPVANRPPVEIRSTLQRTSAPETPIRLTGGVEYSLAPCQLAGVGRWVLAGPEDLAARRPRIRIRLNTSDAPDPLARNVLFRLPTASLEMRNIDLVVEAVDVPPDARLILFEAGAGVDLNLSHCTVTMAGSWPRSTVVAVLPPQTLDHGPGAKATPMTTAVWMSDCLIRTGCDVIDVAGGGRLELELKNTVIGATGAVIHGRGSSRELASPDATLKVAMRQVTCRTGGGLLQLDTTTGEPVLPLADMTVRDSVLSTTDQAVPLIRIDGQESMDDLRDRLRWEGHDVAYHQIEVYRRDQTKQPGNVPQPFRRTDWDVAVGPREETPFHGDVKFTKSWDTSRPLWTLRPDDMQLDAASPVRGAGPDFGKIPDSPAAPRS